MSPEKQRGLFTLDTAQSPYTKNGEAIDNENPKKEAVIVRQGSSISFSAKGSSYLDANLRDCRSPTVSMGQTNDMLTVGQAVNIEKIPLRKIKRDSMTDSDKVVDIQKMEQMMHNEKGMFYTKSPCTLTQQFENSYQQPTHVKPQGDGKSDISESLEVPDENQEVLITPISMATKGLSASKHGPPEAPSANPPTSKVPDLHQAQ